MSTEDLGPLPQVDEYSQNQQRSIDALNALLPNDRFVFRDERANDTGVDGSLEVLVENRATNLRSQVQLKSKTNPDGNQDGSISVPVTTANLNYLLYGCSPLYVLFVVPAEELRFVWARDERLRIENENADWQQQVSVTLRFSTRLDITALDEIHGRVISEGRAHRRINDSLSSAALNESVSVTITDEGLASVSSSEVFDVIFSQGMSIVAAGYAQGDVRLIVKTVGGLTEKMHRSFFV